MNPVTHEQLRDAGFSGIESYRDEVALRLLCAFNGVDPVKAPPGWSAHPNASTRKAWERVAAEAEQIFDGRHVGVTPQGHLIIRHALDIMRLVAALRAIASECDPNDPEWQMPIKGRRLIWDLATKALEGPSSS